MSIIAIYKNNHNESSKPKTSVSPIRKFVEPPPAAPPTP